MNKFEVIKSVLNLKWLCQKEDQFISSNPFQLVDYQVGQAKDTHLFIIVDGQIRGSFQYVSTEPEFNDMIECLIQEDKGEENFNLAKPGESRIMTFQNFARRQAHEKSTELQQIKAELARKENIQRQLEVEQATLHTQKLEQQQKLVTTRSQLFSCIDKQLHGKFNWKHASHIFELVVSKEVPADKRANAFIRLAELCTDKSSFKFEYGGIGTANGYMRLSFNGEILAETLLPQSITLSEEDTITSASTKLELYKQSPSGSGEGFLSVFLHLEENRPSIQLPDYDPYAEFPPISPERLQDDSLGQVTPTTDMATAKVSPLTISAPQQLSEINKLLLNIADKIGREQT